MREEILTLKQVAKRLDKCIAQLGCEDNSFSLAAYLAMERELRENERNTLRTQLEQAQDELKQLRAVKESAGTFAHIIRKRQTKYHGNRLQSLKTLESDLATREAQVNVGCPITHDRPSSTGVRESLDIGKETRAWLKKA